MAEFDAALRKLAIHCGFVGDRLSEEHTRVCVRLLTEADLTYKRTIEIVQAAERTTKRHDASEVLYTQTHQKPRRPPQDQLWW